MTTQKNKKNIAAIYPLSPMQQGMLFHSLYEPESGVYFEQSTINLTGKVKVSALATAWQKVVDRHPILRTFFTWENRKTPLQVVLKEVTLSWQTLDWREIETKAQDQQLQQLLNDQRKAGFDLGQAPLMHCTLVRLSDETYTFIWNRHHILMDGWCLSIIFQDVLSFYEAELQGVNCQLPTPRPYEDYITWLRDQNKEEAIAFWQETLQGFTAPTPLVVDNMPSHVPIKEAEGYQEVQAVLPSDCTQKLNELAQQNHITLATIVQAAWALLLGRYNDETDIVFGVTVSGRPPALARVEEIVGLFINTLPMRVDISTQENILPWLQQVQQKSVALQQYSYTPLVEIQAQGDLSDVSGGMSLFESIVVFENYPVDSEKLNKASSLQWSGLEGRDKTNYPLTVIAIPGDELFIKISYDSTRFEEATIERMWSHLKNILEEIANNPAQNVGDLSLLSAAERHQLLVEWTQTTAEPSAERFGESCIHELFERQAAKTPDAIALVFNGEQLTYQELDHKANQLAHHLQTLGVRPEEWVGICVERSLEMVVGLLGILKAGGAYVPIDPTYLAERLDYILEDSEIELLVTQASLLERLPTPNASTICLDRDEEAISAYPTSKVNVEINPDNTAYLIYTAWSTGEPEGVVVEHQNFVRLLTATESRYHFNSNDVWTNFHSIAFDFSVWEIWGALSYGGKLVIVPHCVSQDTQRFYHLLAEAKVTVLHQTPSDFYPLINLEKDRAELPPLSLRFIILGGEALELPLLKPWFEQHGDTLPQLVNMHGITETTGYVTSRPLTIADTTSISSVIGRPLLGLQLYILDQHCQPVPIGVPGEIHVGGAGVTRGYLNRSTLTAERFIPHPFKHSTFERTYGKTSDELYKTGDLARYLPNGEIEYLGKIDHQVLVAYVVADVDYVAPRTPREEIIANLFSAVLEIDNIGIHDNFFELGGHSLLATQLISRMRAAFSQEIPLRALFESPTVAELDRAISNCQNDNDQRTLPPIQPRDETAALTLSFAQERLWFINQLEGNSANYNLPGAFRITGELDHNALKQALSEIVSRHEVLRTSFTSANGQPLQVIHPATLVNIPLVDLQSLEKTEQEKVVSEAAQKEADTPFNLENVPLIRCNLLQLERQEYVLLLTMHHIASDGWSMGVFIREISSLYQAFSQGSPAALSALPIQYADFALWQRQHLSGERLDTQIDYWKQQLKDAPELLQLPTDRPRPNVQTYRGKTQSFYINQALTQKINELAQNSDTTLFMTLYAAFSTLLNRYSGQSDICVGSPIANRNHRELEGLIGFFVNSLVLRTRFDNNPSFKQLLAQVRETTLKAYENQDVPFEQVVEALNPRRSLSYAPLAQVIFVLQNTPMEDVALPNLTFREIEQEGTTAKHDLWMSITETDAGLVSDWQYNTDLFDSSTIERMFANFQTLLEAIVETPGQKVSELALLSEPERHQLLVEWNDTAVDYSTERCVHQLFEKQVTKTPDAIAVEFGTEQLTYQQLNQRANQLARHLQALGVEPETLVGICLDRSLDMIVGVLAIIKAGGAYVPLDPKYPQERLRHMLNDSGAKVLLTQRDLTDALPKHRAKIVCIEEERETIGQNASENLAVAVREDNLAYVIYTSGSTGKPKGVAIEQGSIFNLVQAQANLFEINPTSRVLQFVSLSFDVSASDIFTALTTGARLIVATAYELLPGLNLQKVLKNHAVTHVALPPSALEVLPSEPLPHLSHIIVGGETCSRELINQWSVGRQLFNAYGPTEATVASTVSKISDRTEKKATKITIGRPLANTQIYLLDEHLQPVPIGVSGELYISGNGLARGYLNQPALTQERFITLPAYLRKGTARNERLYKTGDLARYLPNGEIEYLGRIDNQVKIRGFRIELGEIEAILNAHPDVSGSVVIARADTPENSSGHKGLVAYVSTTTASTTTASITSKQLREYLDSTLPDYMVPPIFVILETLPLTPNGKVDRNALPAADIDSLRESEYVAPSTSHEKIIANIFASLLELENVAIDDDFFDLGGHSLLATQVVSRLNKTFAIEISLQQIFETPTVEGLAKTVDQQLLQTGQKDQAGQAALRDLTPALYPAIPKRSEGNVIPLSWGQERLWFINQLEENRATYNTPVVFRITGALDTQALQLAFAEIVSRHEILRTCFTTVKSQPIQVINPEATLDIPLWDLQGLAPAEREKAVMEAAKKEAATPFDLKRAPLIRGSLLKLDSQDYVLLLTMHHIVVDGWSMRVLIQEVSSLYQAFSEGQPSPLSDLPIQYADFAVWQRQHLSEDKLNTQLDYWKQQLSGAPEQLELPTDRPRPEVQSYRGATHCVTFDADLMQKLQQLSRESGTTLFMTLQAAFSTLLYRYSGQSDILVGSAVSGRDRRELESLIGFFLNTLVLRTRFDDNPSFNQLLANVKETTLQAYQHQGLPFEKVVEALRPERSLSYSPLYQASFVLQNISMPPLALPGMTITPIDSMLEVSKCDLLLSMTETEKGLESAWQYNTDLFDSSTIERLTGYFQTLLKDIVENPETRVRDLRLSKQSDSPALSRQSLGKLKQIKRTPHKLANF
ncbi:MAG: amino acid adenylation domain-containing protein [Cyanobacteria bacterium P01_F01_bin.86]